MTTYIKLPAKKGAYVDGDDNRFNLIDESTVTYASPNIARLTGDTIEEAAASGGLSLVPTPVITPPVPFKVSPRQLRLAMLAGGINPSTVTAAIDAIPDAAQKAAALVEWEYAIWFERTHPLINSLAAGLGLTSDDVDNLFRQANQI